MLIRLFLLVAVALCCIACESNPRETSSVATGTALRHVVIFKFKDDTVRAQIREIEDAFRDLPGKITQIRDFEWGTNVSPEGLADGYTHCFFVTFHNEEDRATYLPHPAHEAFVAKLEPVLEKALVLVYFVQR